MAAPTIVRVSRPFAVKAAAKRSAEPKWAVVVCVGNSPADFDNSKRYYIRGDLAEANRQRQEYIALAHALGRLHPEADIPAPNPA
jgi:hypothetical protein